MDTVELYFYDLLEQLCHRLKRPFICIFLQSYVVIVIPQKLKVSFQKINLKNMQMRFCTSADLESGFYYKQNNLRSIRKVEYSAKCVGYFRGHIGCRFYWLGLLKVCQYFHETPLCQYFSIKKVKMNHVWVKCSCTLDFKSLMSWTLPIKHILTSFHIISASTVTN